MAIVACQGHRVALDPEETVLEGLLRAGVPVPNACRAGACQSCLVRATDGAPPPTAQIGLKETLRRQGYFLACVACPDADLTVATEDAAALAVPAHVERVDHLSWDVLRVRLALDGEFAYEPGQFITLLRADGLARPYSIASLPDDMDGIELHVRLVAGGLMSGWLASPGTLGASLRVRGPSGSCFYVPGRPEQPLLLVGTGAGLAPLWGIARAALRGGHHGPIRLFHGARNADGLYLTSELRELAERHPPFEYIPCAMNAGSGAGLSEGPVDAIVAQRLPSLKGQRVFLCGHPELVFALRRKAFLAGAALNEIHADAFQPSAPAAANPDS
jgi:NAD(P)H-flavin reductase/ferredoxin